MFIYSWETKREVETQAEGEAGSSQGAQVGLDPQTGSHPKLKADVQPVSHPGIPKPLNFKVIYYSATDIFHGLFCKKIYLILHFKIFQVGSDA